MKTKLGLTLAVIAIALMSVTAAQAYGPVVGDFPDVYVGDAEFNVGLTQDQNMFLLADAYDFRDFVIDWDTPTTEVLWSYSVAEGGPTGIGLTFINGGKNLGAPGVGQNDPLNVDPSRRITNPAKGIYKASYEIRPNWPPLTAPVLPPPRPDPKGTGASSAVITYWASDTVEVDSTQAILGWVDDGTDSVSYSVSNKATATFDFAVDGTGDFESSTFGGFQAVTFSTASDTLLSMAAGATGTGNGYFGRWQSIMVTTPILHDIIPYEANKLYRVRYAMRTGQANPTLIPGWRVLSANMFFTHSYEQSFAPLALASAMEGHYLSASLQNVDLYLQPADQATNPAPGFNNLVGAGYDGRSVNVAFDILDLNTYTGSTGSIVCEDVTVDCFDRPGAGEVNHVISNPFATLQPTAAPSGTTWQRSSGASGELIVHLQGNTTGNNAIGLSEEAFANGILWRNASYVQGRDVLYRAKYTMSVPSPGTRANFTQFRARWNAELGSLGGLITVARGNGVDALNLSMVPELTSSGRTDYSLVWALGPHPPDMAIDPLLTIIGGPPRIAMSFDGVNVTGVVGADTEGGYCQLDRIEVEAMPVPQP